MPRFRLSSFSSTSSFFCNHHFEHQHSPPFHTPPSQWPASRWPIWPSATADVALTWRTSTCSSPKAPSTGCWGRRAVAKPHCSGASSDGWSHVKVPSKFLASNQVSLFLFLCFIYLFVPHTAAVAAAAFCHHFTFDFFLEKTRDSSGASVAETRRVKRSVAN